MQILYAIVEAREGGFMYGELVVGLNTLFNYIVLVFANKFGNVEATRSRLLFSAFIGALPVTFYPSSILAILFSFFAMTICAFGKAFEHWRKSAIVVLVGAVFAGGLLTVVQTHFQTSKSQGIILLYALISYLSLHYMKKKWLDVRVAKHVTAMTATSTLYVWEAAIPLKVFVDSGNSCTEPISGLPVNFVSVRSLEKFIPDELKEPLFDWNPNGSPTLTEFPDSYLKSIRLVRLLTVQGKSWAVGIKYDRWVIDSGGELKQGYFILTKQNQRYPDEVEAILHVSAMESIFEERGAVHVT